jgi:predicted molibdopterin-dependent oxidoreductase YjgC
LGESFEPRRGNDLARARHRSRGAGRRLHDVPSSEHAGQRRDPDFSDWATNCPEYKVTAVQISRSNGPTDWQERYREQAEQSRRIAETIEAAE